MNSRPPWSRMRWHQPDSRTSLPMSLSRSAPQVWRAVTVHAIDSSARLRVGKAAKSACRRPPCQGEPAPRQRAAPICTLAGMAKREGQNGRPARRPRMTTAEAAVDALDRATASTRSTRCRACRTTTCSTRCSRRSRPASATVHTRHEQGAAYMALGAALATGKPQAYAVVPGPGLLNSSAALLTAYAMNAPVLALIGANSRRRHRPRLRPPARDPRPGRHHRAAGRSTRRCIRSAERGAAPGRRGDARDGHRPARPGGAANARSTSGASPAPVSAAGAAAVRRATASTKTRSARPRSSSARPKSR